jgi:hypothetical protein
MYTENNALLIHQGAIGDFLVSSRLIAFCDTHFGPHSWTYLGKPAHGRLAKALQLIDNFEDFSQLGWHMLFSPDCDPPKPIADFLASFDLIINLICGPESTFSKRLALFCPGNIHHADPKPPEDFCGHTLQFQARQLSLSADPLPKNAYQVRPEILETVRAELEAESVDPAGLILLHPGASSPSKRRPLETFLELANRAKQVGFTPGILLGEVELEKFSKDDVSRLKSAAKPFFDWPLEKLAGLLALARTYIGNDNGVSHLAGAVGTKTKVMFVKHNSKIWRPLGPDVEVISPHTVLMNQLLTEEK